MTIAESDTPERKESRRKVSESPNVWVGEVSWLKAALFEDEDTYIPEIVDRINEIIGEELPVIDDELIQKIKEAFAESSNTTAYLTGNAKEVIEFLEKHCGKKAFTVSW